MTTKKTDAEIEQVVIDGFHILLCSDIEELILAGRYKEAMIVARDVLGLSESELKEMEEIIDDHRLESAKRK